MKKDDVLNALMNDEATERALSELELPYFIHYCCNDRDEMGYAFVKVEEGLLKLPFDECVGSKGYEQFNLYRAVLVDGDAIKYAHTEMTDNVHAFESVFAEYLKK